MDFSRSAGNTPQFHAYYAFVGRTPAISVGPLANWGVLISANLWCPPQSLSSRFFCHQSASSVDSKKSAHLYTPHEFCDGEERDGVSPKRGASDGCKRK